MRYSKRSYPRETSRVFAFLNRGTESSLRLAKNYSLLALQQTLLAFQIVALSMFSVAGGFEFAYYEATGQLVVEGAYAATTSSTTVVLPDDYVTPGGETSSETVENIEVLPGETSVSTSSSESADDPDLVVTEDESVAIATSSDDETTPNDENTEATTTATGTNEEVVATSSAEEVAPTTAEVVEEPVEPEAQAEAIETPAEAPTEPEVIFFENNQDSESVIDGTMLTEESDTEVLNERAAIEITLAETDVQGIEEGEEIPLEDAIVALIGLTITQDEIDDERAEDASIFDGIGDFFRGADSIDLDDYTSDGLTLIEEVVADQILQTGDEAVVAEQLLQVTAVGPDGIPFDIPMEFLSFESGSIVMVIEPQRSFTPGAYEVTVEFTNPITGAVTTIVQNLLWGVLALNADQDVYATGDEAILHMAVLDDEGVPVCNADPTLTVTQPNGQVRNLEVTDTGVCSQFIIGNTEPDYQADFTFSSAGEYVFTLSAEQDGVVRTLKSAVSVADGAPAYVISRESATRNFPFGPTPMEIEIFFQSTTTDVMVAETVPAEFVLSNISRSGTSFIDPISGDQVIMWDNVFADPGETIELSYSYDAPDVSPEFYLVGPLEVHQTPSAVEGQSSILYIEQRAWQIANDEPTPYPGGVSADLSFWVKADAGTLNSGAAVTSGLVNEWQDQSGGAVSSLDTVQSDPDLQQDVINFNPTVRFDTNDYLLHSNTLGIDIFDATDNSVIAVMRYNDVSSGGAVEAGWGETGGRAGYLEVTSNVQRHDFGAVSVSGTTDVRNLIVIARGQSNSSQTTVAINGTVEGTGAAGTPTLTNTNNLLLGQRPIGSDSADVDIAEYILYKNDLAGDTLRRVESYLAVKYGITLDQSTAGSGNTDGDYIDGSGNTIYDAYVGSANPYSTNIAGIGVDAVSGLTQLQSRSVNASSTVTIGGVSANITHGEFLLWAHDGATSTSTNVPSGFKHSCGTNLASF